MNRTCWTLALAAVCAAAAGPARADEPGRFKEVQALQEAMKDAIRKAEPSIACILVSRSDLYRKLFDDAPPEDNPGKLGPYRPRFNPRFNQRASQGDDLKKLDLSDPTNVPESYGSGVVVDPRGLVLTNYHVVRDAAKVYVRLPGGRGSYCDIHAADPRSDLAVLRLLDESVLPVKALKFGPGGRVEKGDWVLSLANPFAAGFRDGSPSASWGVISNVRRRAPGVFREEDLTKTLHHYGTLLQTDARLHLGCSGGALVNLKGELIGLTTALAAVTGGETPGGYAVPLDGPFQEIIKVLMQGREVEYGLLGVNLEPTLTEDRQTGGVLIRMVSEGSPAERAGLRRGHYIMAINDIPIKEVDDLFLVIGSLLAGSEARLEYAASPRDRREKTTATLAKFYYPGKFIASNRPAPVRGLRVDYTSVQTQRLRHPQIRPGVLVRDVLTGSPADRAQLQVDKVITHVGRQAVNTPAEFYAAMNAAKGPVELTLLSPEGRYSQVKLDAN